jgi:hypothetical protein
VQLSGIVVGSIKKPGLGGDDSALIHHQHTPARLARSQTERPG